MASKVVFFCKECGYESSKWMGKCPSCNSWNTFVEEKVLKDNSNNKSIFRERTEAKKLDEIVINENSRVSTGFEEFNRVLGGGLVIGSLTLIGGEPGIGKSTLVMQICNNLAKYGSVLYVSGEESESQVKLRADRLDVHNENILFLNETNISEIENKIDNLSPKFCIIDSIQTIYDDEIPSVSGSVSQVKEATSRLMYIAKHKGITTIILGHVTKDGVIAGPRVLEHMVDTVVYIEGQRFFENRIVRSVKNRFGSTNEIGVFEMNDSGMNEVKNISELFISKNEENVPGSCVTATLEGNSTILLEIQALTAHSFFNMPRRLGNGIDNNKLAIIIAILEKRALISLGTNDVYVNVIGGMKVIEPAIDLAIAISIVSSFKNIPVDSSYVFLGEIGLTGEIRNVNNIEKRIKEIEKLGYSKIFLPYLQYSKLCKEKEHNNLIGVKNINEVIKKVFFDGKEIM